MFEIVVSKRRIPSYTNIKDEIMDYSAVRAFGTTIGESSIT